MKISLSKLVTATCVLFFTAMPLAHADDPNIAFQSFINGRIIKNGKGLITGSTLNQALNLLPPIFYSLGTWDTNGNFTLNGASIPPNPVLLGVPSTPGLKGYLYGNAGTGWTASQNIPAPVLSGTLQAAQFPALGGDCAVTAGSLVTSCTKTGGVTFAPSATTDTTNAGNITTGTLPDARLTTVNSSPGSYGGASSVPTITVDGKGRVTVAGTIAVVAPAGTLSGTTLNSTVVNSSLATFAAGAAANNVGTLGGDLSGTLPNPTVAAGAITSAKMAAGAAYGNLAANSIDPTKMAQANAGMIRGNPTSTGPSNVTDAALTAYMDNALGSTQGTVAYRGAAGWIGYAGFSDLTKKSQQVTGGFNYTINPLGLTTANGTRVVDCGQGPFQSLINAGGGTYTLTAPVADSSCVLQVIGTAGSLSGSAIILGSGFAASPTGAGDAYNGNITTSATVTLTIANPGLVNYTAHGLTSGQIVYLTTTGALPTGISAYNNYYVVNPTVNNFQLSSSPGGAAIAFTGTQSGTQTAAVPSVFLLNIVRASGLATAVWKQQQ